ncbi:hypothetical protein [Chelatococcus asaccharovorans]|uniref:Uncharacterized protein n=1 Tax=Chelatococcus asaccharovorans TaxID=28210 RepID=A0A2V3UAF6_9HYPH|nr:hypothetical protein [Chelatococcus asaccharovorans]MBS7703175.1 hypothetical protein [Chelatococcus asaccharovorans]PXW61504.1 hypothetical protein C7450_10319 [Chelatococcus asaccharovorans]
MSLANVERSTFASGELDKALHARVDLARYQTGLKICENFVVMVEGGVTRRPGTRFVTPLRKEGERSRLIGFEFSADDNYVLVFNDGHMRVMRAGGVVETAPGTPYELAVPFLEADLTKLRTAQSADVIFVAWGGKPKVIKRFAHTNWTIGDYENERGPLEIQNVDRAKRIRASATSGDITLEADFDVFAAGHVGSIWRLDESNVANVPLFKTNETGLTFGALRRNKGNVYSVVSGSDAGPNTPQHDEGDVSSGNGNVVWRFVHGGGGFVRITGFTDARHVSATVISTLPGDVVAPNWTFRWHEPAWSDVKGWPTHVILHDNRLVWARGNRLWLTKIGDFYTFEITDLDDSAVTTLLTSPDGKIVDIQWMMNAGVIVAGTRSSEWMVRGADAFDTITVSNVRAVPDGTEGSASHTPQLVDGGVVFIGRSRRRLHFAQFDRVGEKIGVDELTLYARHILKGGAIGVFYQRDPHRILWIPQENGELVAITFRPDQQVMGWHRHPMVNGAIEDMAIIPSGDASTSELWFTVRRTIKGETRRYVEVMQPFFEPVDEVQPDARAAWFVDSGLSYQGAATTALAGLDHLAGEMVSIIADGVEHRQLVVGDDGTLTLDRPAARIVVGLSVRSRVRTLKAEANLQSGSTKGGTKRASHVLIERLHAAGGEIAINDGDHWEPLLQGGGNPLGVPQPLVTDGRLTTLFGPPSDQLEFELVCDSVYPFTLLGLTPWVDFTEAR